MSLFYLALYYCFAEEEIDDEAFDILTEEVIQGIITKGGPFCKFIKKYKDWKEVI